MEKLLRKTGINQSLRLLLIIASFVFGSSAWGQTETTKTIFSETFDKCDGTGGNDGKWNNISTTPAISADKKWTNANGYGASKCARYGTGSKLGSATTPTLTFTGDATLTFRAGAWNAKNEKTTLKLSISNGTLSASTVTLEKGSFTEYTINITGVTTNPTIKFEGYQKSDSRFFLDDVVITQTTTSGGGSETKTENSLAFESSEATISQTGSLTLNLTTNSPEEVSFSISPALPTDASILMDEKVTVTDGKASLTILTENATEGTYTITATQASTDDFTEGNATCVLKVVAPVEPSHEVKAPTYYKKITSTDELAVGGTYLIVCEGAKKALSATVSTVGYTQGENNTVTNETAAALGEFELIDTSEDYNGAPLYEFLVDNKYLSGTTSKTISLATSVSDNTKWIVDFDANGNVEIDSYSTVTASTPRGLLFQTGQTIKHYAISNRGSSNFPALQLYQKVTDLAISTLTNGYATFVTDVPYAMPKGTCGYAVTVAPQAGVITKTEAYTEGSQVPAQTALLIGGASGTNYYPAVLKENVAATYTGENYMEGKRTEEGYTDTQKGVAVYYYKLALNSASKPGFYYGAADGAAFQLTKPTTAYLAVPQSITPVNGYLIDFDGEETGISTIAPTNGNADGAIYNLNGIRLTQTLRNLPKGVYIVNGKKIIK